MSSTRPETPGDATIKKDMIEKETGHETLARSRRLSQEVSDKPREIYKVDSGGAGSLSTNSITYTLSKGPKYILLALFASALAVDVICGSGVFIFTGAITEDLSILPAQQSWIITAYVVTFSSFLVFWGRVTDLYPPKPIFCYAFLAVGALNIINSVLTDQYAFFVFRALNGIAAAAVVPTAYRMIAQVFPPEERRLAYTLYTMTGSIANVSGTVIAGVFGIIRSHCQMASWRWFFRFVGVAAVIVAIITIILMPKSTSDTNSLLSFKEKMARLDFAGIILIEAAIILLIIALTFGATYGWRTAAFLVPMLISIALFPLVIFYESRLPPSYALIPTATLRLPNILVLVVFALVTLGWWSVQFLAFIETWLYVGGESMIIVAVRTVPIGISAASISVVCMIHPKILSSPRWPIIISMILCSGAYLLYTQAPSFLGLDYWKFIVPGQLYGSAGMQVVLLATNVGIVVAAPPDQTGIVGALLNMAMQLSTAVAMSIQAGLFSIHPGGVWNMSNVRVSFYVEMGWTILWLIGFIIFYRPDIKYRDDPEQAGKVMGITE